MASRRATATWHVIAHTATVESLANSLLEPAATAPTTASVAAANFSGHGFDRDEGQSHSNVGELSQISDEESWPTAPTRGSRSSGAGQALVPAGPGQRNATKPSARPLKATP